MVKKRIADMLQEEAQKFTPTEGEPVIEVTATPVNSPENNGKESDGTLVDIAAEKELSTDATEETSPKRTSPTKAELEATVKELKDTLAQLEESQVSLQKENNSLQKENNSLQKENNSLQKQNTDLQASFSEQKNLAEKLKKELNDTKKDALQLAEANSKLVEEMNALKQKEQEKQEIQQKQEKQHKEIVHQPSSLNYKKSHRTVERLATTQPHPQEEKEEFGADTSSQMWLLD